MAKATNKGEKLVHPKNVTKILVIAIVVIAVIASIVVVNYFLGTNRADKSRASAPTSVSLYGSSKKDKQCQKAKNKNKKECKKKKDDEKKQKKDKSAKQDSSQDNDSANANNNKSEQDQPGALVLGPNDSSNATTESGSTDNTNLADNTNDTTTGPAGDNDNSQSQPVNDNKSDNSSTNNQAPDSDTDGDTSNNSSADNTTDNSADNTSNDTGNNDTDANVPDNNAPADSPSDTSGTSPDTNPTKALPSNDKTADNQNDNSADKKVIEPKKGADLQVIKQTNKSEAGSDEDVVFTTIITNNGPQQARDVIVKASVPAGTEYRAYTSTKGVYDASSGQWIVGNMAPDEKVQLAVTANLAGTAIGTTILDEATIKASNATTADPNQQDNKDAQQVVVTKTAKTPHVDQSVKNIGDNAQEWKLQLSNPDNEQVLKSSFFNPIPKGTFYIADSLTCEVNGESEEESCFYDSDKSQIIWQGTLAPENSGRNVGSPDNSAIITFKTELTKDEQAVANTVCVNWDYNNNSSLEDELRGQQSPNCLTPLIYSAGGGHKRDILVGSLYGIGIGLFFAWLIYLLKKKPTRGATKTAKAAARGGSRRKK